MQLLPPDRRRWLSSCVFPVWIRGRLLRCIKRFRPERPRCRDYTMPSDSMHANGHRDAGTLLCAQCARFGRPGSNVLPTLSGGVVMNQETRRNSESGGQGVVARLGRSTR
jgi:hypothetical protein